MLANENQLLVIPFLCKPRNKKWLPTLIPQADRVIKEWCGRDLELTTYPGAATNGKGDSGIYSGNNQRDLVLRQYPVQSVISVNVDPNAFGGQNVANGNVPFGPGTLLTQGVQYMLQLDYAEGGQPASSCGMLRKIGGAGFDFFGGYYPYTWGGGKLAAYRMPVWVRGDGNIKVSYTAGFPTIPPDLTNAMGTLVSWFIRNQPGGAPLTSESLGGYSYSVMSSGMGQAPELGSLRGVLSQYREIQYPVYSG